MLNVRCGKRFVVMSERTLLAQMLWDLKEAGDGLSYSKMAARSGGLVAVSTLHAVMSGKTKELTPDTIAGLAKILNVSMAHVLSALNDKPLPEPERESEEHARLLAMYEDIPRQCQQDVLDLLEVLQRNHSLSSRRDKRIDRRFAAHGRTDDSEVAPLHGPQNTKRMLGRRFKSSTHQEGTEKERKQR
jgi:transcriptional regulator with XRE-family HTH domain